MLKYLKYITIIFILISPNSFSEKPPSSKATGFFLGFGVGPRVPLGSFSTTTDLGYGVNVEFSYTDNEYLPVFLFATIGFEQYPGSQNFLQETDYSNFHTNSLPVNVGAKYYFPPILENIVLLMPIIQVSASYTYYQKLHEFEKGTGRNNFLEENSKFGFSAGAGVSMFMMEILAAYNYNQSNQFLSFDLKVRIPLYINM
ncbi:MAG TPA: hypothetical protein PKD67_12445 [Ignavibacteriaceae bacterium]|nr:hypothetical protein [Ignavibacteriaceae bacterium]